MGLFISTVAASEQATVHLFSITRCDAGLGVANTSGVADFEDVTYAKSASGTGQDRIEALVGIPTGTAISIHALAAGTSVPDGQGGSVLINQVGGVTYAGVPHPALGNHIQAAYCYNNTMFVFDTGNNQISLPTPVILFHELAHAFHRANGTFNAADPEGQAINDENLFRAQVGLALRDPANSGGGEGAGNGQTVPSCSGMPPGPPPASSPCCSC